MEYTREGVEDTREGVEYTREGVEYTREGVDYQTKVFSRIELKSYMFSILTTLTRVEAL